MRLWGHDVLKMFQWKREKMARSHSPSSWRSVSVVAENAAREWGRVPNQLYVIIYVFKRPLTLYLIIFYVVIVCSGGCGRGISFACTPHTDTQTSHTVYMLVNTWNTQTPYTGTVHRDRTQRPYTETVHRDRTQTPHTDTAHRHRT
jgi:hypothetical protein